MSKNLCFDGTRCPNDAGEIFLVVEKPLRDGTVRFYWCEFCYELFAMFLDKNNVWQDAASFSYDNQGYKLRKRYQDSTITASIEEIAATLPPPHTFVF